MYGAILYNVISVTTGRFRPNSVAYSCCVIVMSWTEILYIFVVLFLIIHGLFFYCAQGAGAARRKCTMKINARHASGFGLVAIFGIIVWTERTCFVSRWSGGYFIPIPSMFGPVPDQGCAGPVAYINRGAPSPRTCNISHFNGCKINSGGKR